MKQQHENESHLSRRESRELARVNRREIRQLEKQRRECDFASGLTVMKDEKNIVEIDRLQIRFYTDAGILKAVDGVSFDIPKGAVVGVVGESGCGKSVVSLSLMQLLQRPQGQITGGEIRLSMDGGSARDIVRTPEKEMVKLRGSKISMIFQEPATSLNPVFRCGKQIDEVVALQNPGISKTDIKARTLALLDKVGIANAEGIHGMYPHELSGGMRQRVMIAMALACAPELIIADEPTTALDVTIQAQILDLLKDLKNKIESSILLITHDLGIIAGIADYVVVMYAGRVVEKGTAADIFHNPLHPYTIGLLRAVPAIGGKSDTLCGIPGNVPNPVNLPKHCYFLERCGMRTEKCGGSYPPEIKLSDTHAVSCLRFEKPEVPQNE